MAKEVWKYPLRVGINNVSMPDRATPLTAQMQHGEIMMWAEVDPDQKRTQRSVEVVGTGFQLPPRGAYLATVQDGGFVWHVYL